VEVKGTAYITLIRPLLEYFSATIDPHLSKDVHNLEHIQWRAFVTSGSSWEIGIDATTSITSLISQIKWPLLSTLRRNSHL